MTGFRPDGYKKGYTHGDTGGLGETLALRVFGEPSVPHTASLGMPVKLPRRNSVHKIASALASAGPLARPVEGRQGRMGGISCCRSLLLLARVDGVGEADVLSKIFAALLLIQ